MKISIITPSFNHAAFLRRTMDSVLRQRGGFDLEWLVIDGGSTDGTPELLRSISDPRVRWVSEPDGGQSHAINKGLAMAGGDVTAWLNSDDLYTDGALAAVAEAFERNTEAQWLVGRCDVIDAGDREIRRGVTRYKNGKLSRYSYARLLRENFISQPAVFWRRRFGESLSLRIAPSLAAGEPRILQAASGAEEPAARKAACPASNDSTTVALLDESLHWTMDYDLWLRMGRVAPPLVLDRTLARFRMHGQSKSGQVDRRQFDEGRAVMLRYVDGDWRSRWAHRLNVEKIVAAYRVMRLLGR